MSRFCKAGACSSWLTKLFVVAGLLLVALLAPAGFAQSGSTFQLNPLTLDNNYFVTGDYVAAGVGLRYLGNSTTKLATGTITMPDETTIPSGGVPPGGDVVVGLLFWQTVEANSTTFEGAKGFFGPSSLGAPGAQGRYPISGTPVGDLSTPVTWSSGGCGGGGGTKTIRTYVADVTGNLPVDSSGNVQPNTSYQVSLANVGSSSGPLTLGATLVIIYRIVRPEIPLRAVSFTDGTFSQNNGAQQMGQILKGFYQQDGVLKDVKMTHMVSGGLPNKGENVYFTPTANATPMTGSLLTSPYDPLPPFPGHYAGSWDNTTWYLPNITIAGDGVGTSVAPTDQNSGCVSWGGIIFSAAVQDSDHDGLLDQWETAKQYTDVITGKTVYLTGCGQAQASCDPGVIGADPGVPDIFVQVDYMCSTSNGTSCNGVTSYLPTATQNGKTALESMTEVFWNQGGIRLHPIIGNAGAGYTGAIPEPNCTTDDYLTTPPTLCPFLNQSGVVGWKSGFLSLKYQPTNYADETSCQQHTDCLRRFPLERKDSYHYMMFAHALAVPKWNFQDGSLKGVSVFSASGNYYAKFTTSTNPQLTNSDRVTVAGFISDPTLEGTYLVQSSDSTSFTVQLYAPASTTSTCTDGSFTYTYCRSTDPYLGVATGQSGTISGYSDVGGQNSVISLGNWPLSAQTFPTQAGTTMHELGHSIALTHGGFYFDHLLDSTPSYLATFEDNCKPNFQTVMNYFFQVDLLAILGGTDRVLGYSNQELMNYAQTPTPGPDHLPLALDETSLLGVTGLSTSYGPAPTYVGLPATYPTTKWYAPTSSGGTMFHCDGTLGSTSMNVIEGATVPIPWVNPWSNNQDINFNGTTTDTMRGYNDWAHVDLRQIGAAGSADAGGKVGIGGGKIGIGGGKVGIGGGKIGIGGGKVGIGGGKVGIGGGKGEITHETANSYVRPPRNLSAAPLTSPTRVRLSFYAPTFGTINNYRYYKSSVLGSTYVDFSPAGSTQPITKDDDDVRTCTIYTYYVTAFAYVTNPNDPSSQVLRESVASNSVSITLPCTFTGFISPLQPAGPTSYSGSFGLNKALDIKWLLQGLQKNGTPFYATDAKLNRKVSAIWAGTPSPKGTCANALPQPDNGNTQVLYDPKRDSTTLPATNTSGTFSYITSKNQFDFTWTKTSPAGCYVIQVELTDNLVYKTWLQLK